MDLRAAAAVKRQPLRPAGFVWLRHKRAGTLLIPLLLTALMLGALYGERLMRPLLGFTRREIRTQNGIASSIESTACACAIDERSWISCARVARTLESTRT